MERPGNTLLVMPFRSVDFQGFSLQGGTVMQSPMMEDNIAGDTSRSPIPIDPELNRHMMR